MGDSDEKYSHYDEEDDHEFEKTQEKIRIDHQSNIELHQRLIKVQDNFRANVIENEDYINKIRNEHKIEIE